MQNSEFLSRGLFDECVKYAQDEGDLRLAALIHAASGSNHIRDILRHCAHEDVRHPSSIAPQRKEAILFIFFSDRRCLFKRFSKDHRHSIGRIHCQRRKFSRS